MQQRSDDKLICLAAVASAHGIRGAIKLRCFTQAPENVTAYGPVYNAHGQKLFKLKPLGPCKGGIIVKPTGIDDRNQAEALIGQQLFVPRTNLPAADEDEYYFEDLVGLTVESADGLDGWVTAVDDHGAAPVLEIETRDGSKRLVPFTRQHVPEVDLISGKLTVCIDQEIGDGQEVDIDQKGRA